MPAESSWFAKPHRSVRIDGFALLIATALCVVFGLAFGTGSRDPHSWIGFCFAGLGACCLALFYVKNLRWAHFMATKQDLGLVESLKDPYWVIELTIFRDNLVSSTDHGVLSFANGALYFYGWGCSFLIGSQDVQARPPRLDALMRRPWPIYNRQPWVPRQLLRLKHPMAHIELGFTVLAMPGKSLRQQSNQLDEALGRFIMSDAMTLERSYPPLWGFDPYTFKPKQISS